MRDLGEQIVLEDVAAIAEVLVFQDEHLSCVRPLSAWRLCCDLGQHPAAVSCDIRIAAGEPASPGAMDRRGKDA